MEGAGRIVPSANLSDVKNKAVRERLYRKMKAAKGEAKRKRRQQAKQQPSERSVLVPRTVENSKKTDPHTINDPNDPIVAETMRTDDFADFFVQPASYEPKVLLTSSRAVTAKTARFIESLADLIPNAEFIRRGPRHLIRDVVAGAVERSYSDVLLVGESNGLPRFLTMIHLPNGPTAYFRLSSVRLPKQLQNHGTSTPHYPELILNNFGTHLGLTVGRFFASLFPKGPEFAGRQAVTFHNQRDFVFVRRHRYMFREKEDGTVERADLQEIGPRFCLKLLALQRGTHNKHDGDYVWQRGTAAEERNRFYL